MLLQQELGEGERARRFGRCGRPYGACFVVMRSSPEASSWKRVFGEEPLVVISFLQNSGDERQGSLGTSAPPSPVSMGTVSQEVLSAPT